MHVIKKLPNLILCILLFFSISGMAQQAPFAGGEGDGYDMAVWEASTSVLDNFSSQIKFAPHPFVSGGWVHLSSSSPIQQANISLLDIAGKLVLTQTWKWGESFSVKLPELPAGFYMLHIQTAEKVAVKKVQIVTE